MSGRLFIFGLGYAGLAIARQARGAGWSVAATATTAEKVSQLATEGWAPELFAQPNASAREAFSTPTHLLCTIPPDEQGDPALRHYASSFARLKPRPVWLGYLSTPGIYGDTGGGVGGRAGRAGACATTRHSSPHLPFARDLRSGAQRHRAGAGRHGALGRQAGP